MIKYEDLSLKEKSVFNVIEEELILLDKRARNKLLKLLLWKWIY